MAHRLLGDAFAAAQIEEALVDLAGALEPEDAAWLRTQLAGLLEDDPALREALAGARPHDLAHSGQRSRHLQDDDDAGTAAG